MTLKCSAYRKSRHFCNDKDPTFDTNWAIFRWAKKNPPETFDLFNED